MMKRKVKNSKTCSHSVNFLIKFMKRLKFLNPKKIDEYIRKKLPHDVFRREKDSLKFPLTDRKKIWFNISGARSLMINFEETYFLLLKESESEEYFSTKEKINKVFFY